MQPSLHLLTEYCIQGVGMGWWSLAVTWVELTLIWVFNHLAQQTSLFCQISNLPSRTGQKVQDTQPYPNNWPPPSRITKFSSWLNAWAQSSTQITETVILCHDEVAKSALRQSARLRILFAYSAAYFMHIFRTEATRHFQFVPGGRQSLSKCGCAS